MRITMYVSLLLAASWTEHKSFGGRVNHNPRPPLHTCNVDAWCQIIKMSFRHGKCPGTCSGTCSGSCLFILKKGKVFSLLNNKYPNKYPGRAKSRKTHVSRGGRLRGRARAEQKLVNRVVVRVVVGYLSMHIVVLVLIHGPFVWLPARARSSRTM